MAYLVEVQRPCDTPGCIKTAVVEVRNRRNEPISQHCRTHGKRKLAEIQAMEEREDQAHG